MQGHWSKLMGGAQYQVKCIIEALQGTDAYEIFFIARNYNENYVPQGYKLIGLKYPRKTRRGAVVMLSDFYNIPAVLRKLRPDIVYQRVACWQTGLSAHWARKHGSKMVWHISSDMDVTPPAGLRLGMRNLVKYINFALIKYGILHADRIIAQTGDQSRLLKKYYNRYPDKIVYNFHPKPQETIVKDPQHVTVLWVSNLKPLKRPEVFIQLAEDSVDRPNLSFQVVGGLQGTEEWCGGLLKRMEKLPNLSYLRAKPQAEVNSLLAKSHILVNTSEVEGFSNTFIQAWMRKVPVLSLEVDPDGILGAHGIGACTYSYEKMLQKLWDLSEDAALRSDMGRRAQTFAFQKHSVDNAEQLHQLLQNC